MSNGILVVDLFGPSVDVRCKIGFGVGLDCANPCVNGAVIFCARGGLDAGVVVFCDEGGLLIGRELGGCGRKKRGGHGGCGVGRVG